mmetsp:Transcript_23929/g.77802  ORF Transcript_23929/g.77802 Transcript_23929/m.77802 type:complete len:202 (-) Transcript_23929:753-1358(-)
MGWHLELIDSFIIQLEQKITSLPQLLRALPPEIKGTKCMVLDRIKSPVVHLSEKCLVVLLSQSQVASRQSETTNIGFPNPKIRLHAICSREILAVTKKIPEMKRSNPDKVTVNILKVLRLLLRYVPFAQLNSPRDDPERHQAPRSLHLTVSLQHHALPKPEQHLSPLIASQTSISNEVPELLHLLAANPSVLNSPGCLVLF